MNCFKYHNEFIAPKFFALINNNNLFDKNQFIICEKNLTIIQYCYEKNYKNKIYHFNSSQVKQKNDKKVVKILSLDDIIFLLCYNSEYYIIHK